MNLSEIKVTPSTQNDLLLISRIYETAFESNSEAELAIELLNDRTAFHLISMIAFKDNRAIGHILFTRVRFKGKTRSPKMHILCPMAVIPEFQNLGVGSKLISYGISKLAESGSKLVFVLGHTDYYLKSGFIVDAGKLGFKAPYKIPGKYSNAWMVREIKQGSIEKHDGEIVCPDSLDKEIYWTN